MQDYLKGFFHDFRSSLGIVVTCLNPDTPIEFKGDTNNSPQSMAMRQAEKAILLVQEFESALEKGMDRHIISEPVTAAMIHTLLDEFVGLYPNVEVRFTCPNSFILHTDLNILRRVIDNCVSNSLKAGKSPNVLITCDFDGEVFTILVKDSGIGMSQKQLDRIGLGFSTTGGGKGTRILMDLIVRAGGVAHWESILDVGTCVRLNFAALSTGTDERLGHQHKILQ